VLGDSGCGQPAASGVAAPPDLTPGVLTSNPARSPEPFWWAPRANLLMRMHEWDYYLGIGAVKGMHGLYQGTLVAQGAFLL
jgi:hypothetical protein